MDYSWSQESRKSILCAVWIRYLNTGSNESSFFFKHNADELRVSAVIAHMPPPHPASPRVCYSRPGAVQQLVWLTCERSTDGVNTIHTLISLLMTSVFERNLRWEETHHRCSALPTCGNAGWTHTRPASLGMNCWVVIVGAAEREKLFFLKLHIWKIISSFWKHHMLFLMKRPINPNCSALA